MRDSYFSDDPAELTERSKSTAPVRPAPDRQTDVNGVRHSIRPRTRKPKSNQSHKTPLADRLRASKTTVEEITTTPSTEPVVAPKKVVETPVMTPKVQIDTPVDLPHAAAETPLISDEVTSLTPSMPEEAPAPAPKLIGWDDLHKVDAGARQAANKGIPVVDLARDSSSHKAFDLLRTRLRQTTQENNWVNIGITAPTSGAGTTFTAVNLALSLSRVRSSRTVLMDFNLRDPKVAEALDMVAPGEIEDYLLGDASITDHMMRISETLALGLNASPDENASETLQNRLTHDTLDQMRNALAPELVIYDMPAMLASDDVSAFIPQLDGVLIVSDGTQTTASQLLECEQMLEGRVPLLGVVLNRARRSSIKRYS